MIFHETAHTFKNLKSRLIEVRGKGSQQMPGAVPGKGSRKWLPEKVPEENGQPYH